MFATSLTGDEEEESPYDTNNIEGVILRVKYFSNSFFSVIRDPDFLTFYSRVEALDQDIMPTDLNDCGKDFNI